MKRLIALGIGIILCMSVSGRANADTITYIVDYHMDPDHHCHGAPGEYPGFHCIPDFTFSFETDGYVTTTGMFPLASPITFSYGPGTAQFTYAGTNNRGVWVFGDASTAITDGAITATYPYMSLLWNFIQPDPPYYQTWPGTPRVPLFGGLYYFHTDGAVGIIDNNFYTFGGGGGGGYANLTLVEGRVPDTASSFLLFGVALIALVTFHRRIPRTSRLAV